MKRGIINSSEIIETNIKTGSKGKQYRISKLTSHGVNQSTSARSGQILC